MINISRSPKENTKYKKYQQQKIKIQRKVITRETPKGKTLGKGKHQIKTSNNHLQLLQKNSALHQTTFKTKTSTNKASLRNYHSFKSTAVNGMSHPYAS